MVNLHFSLLPRWRGAAPVERAILAGDRETGVCLMKVEEGLDTGPVYATRRVPMDEHITLDALRVELVDVASALVVDALADGVAGLPDPEPQRGEVTLADKITREDLHLDWSDARSPTRTGRASPTGLDHLSGQAPQRARGRGGSARAAVASGIPGELHGDHGGHAGAARCACSGCSQRAVLPCQPTPGCAASARRPASVSGTD